MSTGFAWRVAQAWHLIWAVGAPLVDARTALNIAAIAEAGL